MTEQSNDPPDAPIRVLLANLPPLLIASITRFVTEQQDMVCLGAVDGYVSLFVAIKDGVDVLILGAGEARPMPGVCSLLLGEFPHLRIVVLPATGDAYAYYMALTHRPLPPMGRDSLIESIRLLHHCNTTLDSEC